MQKIYTETLQLRSCHCDLGGAWRPGSILESMQETAGTHSAIYGLDHETMERMGVAWVISRVKVEMQRMPHVGETVLIETYPTPARHMFFPRSHIFRDQNGEIIGRANSLWVLMDIESRRLTKNQTVTETVPDNPDLEVAAGMPATVRALDAAPVCDTLIPKYTDIDINRHVNNTKYVDWACNALGLDILSDKLVTAFDINYDAEILPGCMLNTELTISEDKFAFLGFSDGKRHFGVTGALADRRR